MRTSQQIYNQIRWDPRFRPTEYVLGLLARRSTDIEEMPLIEFQPNGDIPWHRILYFKRAGGLVWDRATRLDNLVPEGAGGNEQERLNLATFNCCAGRHGLPLANRLGRIQELLSGEDFDLIALQEVGTELLVALEEHFNSVTFVGGDHPAELQLMTRLSPRASHHVELSPKKWALLVEFDHFTVAVVHFTSDYRGDSSQLRASQWRELQAELKNGHWLAVGDFNAGDREVQGWLGTARITEVGAEGPTFDPPHNPWAAQTSRSGKSARYDRIFLSTDLAAQFAPTKSRIVTEEPASDHYLLKASLERQVIHPPTHLSALAILPPRRLISVLQPIRADHDPAYQRWMPHLNLVYPAPVQIDLAKLQEVLGRFEAFPVRLAGLEVFEHSQSLTVYLRPDADSTARIGELRERLLEALGESQSDEFAPHLTIARSKGTRGQLEPRLKAWAQALGELNFRVGSLAWLTRRPDTPFQINEGLLLRRPGFAPRELVGTVQKSCPGGQIEVVGSSLWVAGQDVDLVCLGPDPSEAWPQARKVGAWLRLQIEERDVDLGVTQGDSDCPVWQSVTDARALAAHIARSNGEEEFGPALSRLTRWVEERRIKGQAYGFPGGLAWAVALACLGPEFSPEFRRRLAAWDWSQPLGLGSSDGSSFFNPMTILAPGPPERNLTRSVTSSTLAVVVEELRGRPTRDGVRLDLHCPPDPALIGEMEGRAMGLIVDVEKKLGRRVRPYPGQHRPGSWAWQLGLPVDIDRGAAMQLARANLPVGAQADWVGVMA